MLIHLPYPLIESQQQIREFTATMSCRSQDEHARFPCEHVIHYRITNQFPFMTLWSGAWSFVGKRAWRCPLSSMAP